MHIAQNWRLNAQRYSLKGVRCEKCGKVAFPPRDICQDCREAEIKAGHLQEIRNREVVEMERAAR